MTQKKPAAPAKKPAPKPAAKKPVAKAEAKVEAKKTAPVKPAEKPTKPVVKEERVLYTIRLEQSAVDKLNSIAEKRTKAGEAKVTHASVAREFIHVGLGK